LEILCKNKIKVAIDVGGNVGRYAELIARNNPEVRLFSLEPHPVTYRALKASAARFGYVAVNSAAGAENGHINLYDHASSDGSEHASILRDVIEGVHGSAATYHRVLMTTLDAFIEERGIDRVTLLKVDTEGNEFQVLSGARRAISEGRIELIHFEFNVTNVVSRVFMRDFYQLLIGYRLFRMLPDGVVALPPYGLNVADVEVFAFQNILAIQENSPLLDSASLS